MPATGLDNGRPGGEDSPSAYSHTNDPIDVMEMYRYVAKAYRAGR